MKRMACAIGFSLFFAVVALAAFAQNQAPANSDNAANGQSLGDYARQVRKGSATTAKPKVFDNDNLPKDDKLSVVGKAAEPGATSEAAQEEPATPAAGEPKTESKPATEEKSASAGANPQEEEAAKQAAWKQWSDKIAAQKDQIDLLQRELDVAQKEYQLRAAAMYADVGNRLRNSADWDKQDAQYKQQIADKQKAVDDAKQRLDEMVEEARKAGVPASIREP